MCATVFDCFKDIPNRDFQSLLKWTLESSDYFFNETEICGQIYSKNAALEEVDILARIMRKNWSHLQNVVLNESTISSCELTQIRTVIRSCFTLIVEALKCCECPLLKQKYIQSCCENIKKLLPLILPMCELEKEIYLKLVNPSSSNKDKCPIYQYFHTYLEAQFNVLIFFVVSGQGEDLETYLNKILKDLIWLGESGHRRNNSAFVCKCSQDFWLFLQILCEQNLGPDYFWAMFNKAVENFNNDYVLWLLKDVAALQAYDLNGQETSNGNERVRPNFALLESSLKNVITGEFNISILTTLKSIEPIVCHLWIKWAKIEVYQILWDYFSKQLNTSIRSSTNLSLPELVDLIDTILWAPKDCERDFELFLSILTSHLNEYPHHWGRMKGRIYSQLGPNKLKDLNSGGLFNVLLLFLALTKVNFEELSKKFVNFIDCLGVEKRQTRIVWTFYSALVVRYVRENRSLEPITPSLIKMLEDATNDQKLFPLIKHFVDNLDVIVGFSSNLQLHQWLLINTWLHKYMTTCYYSDLINLLNLLCKILDKINDENWCDWEPVFKNFVYPALKYSRSTSEITGTVAAKIAILSPSLLFEAFTFFNSDTVTTKVSANFLCALLDNYPNSFMLTNHQETIALQSWVKFCLLTKDSYENFTRQIVKLDIVPEFIKASIVSTADPLYTFIDCIGNELAKRSQSEDLINLCDIIFGQAEKWISQYFVQPENETIVLRIYTCLGLAFFKIGSLIYNKHKSNCPFARLVSAILLPTELVIGKPLNQHILQSIKKTWHLFFGATVKLNSTNDVFIDRVLRDMVVKYMPHFSTVDSPMLKCLDNEITADVLLEKMANAFFKQPTKEAESNVFKALKFLNDFVQSTTSLNLMKLVINKTLYGVFEVIMFHNQKNMAVAMVTNIASSPVYSQVKTDFEETIVAITEKHLAFNTPNYFQLLNTLAKLASESLKTVMPKVKQQLSNVERMRGVGYDKNLRLSIERLEANLFKF